MVFASPAKPAPLNPLQRSITISASRSSAADQHLSACPRGRKHRAATEDCEPPVLLAPLKRRNLFGIDGTEARNRLAEYLASARKPKEDIKFPVETTISNDHSSKHEKVPFPGDEINSNSAESEVRQVARTVAARTRAHNNRLRRSRSSGFWSIRTGFRKRVRSAGFGEVPRKALPVIPRRS